VTPLLRADPIVPIIAEPVSVNIRLVRNALRGQLAFVSHMEVVDAARTQAVIKGQETSSSVLRKFKHSFLTRAMECDMC
jgi:hypothetical protein